jgi:23S rRNA (uracil1939-C5)-methyltransferase
VAPKSREPFHAKIEGLSHDGRGVARIDGKVWFVEGALPGEKVIVKPIRGKRSYSLGITETILNPSASRVEPRCAAFGVCGGCALQHLEYPKQLAFKKTSVIETFGAAGVQVPQDIVELQAEPWSYRRRARLGARLVPKKGGVLVGFRERNKGFITPLTHCPVIHPSVDSVLARMSQLIGQLSIPDRIPQIEVAAGENGTALVFRHLSPLTESDFSLLKQFGVEEGLLIYTQSKGPETAIPLDVRATPELFYTLKAFDLKISFSVTQFVQVNSAINELLVELAVDWLAPNEKDGVLDLFCGLGNFSLALARRAGQVLGVEGDETLVRKAEGNASVNGINNARFQARDLFSDSVLDWDPGHYSQILVDPPRGGALDVLRNLSSRLNPDRIAYVSCNPATLARDAAYLTGSGGYRLTRLAVADMFPHTAHIESAALFERSA